MKQIGDLSRTNAFKPYKTQDLPGIEGFTFLGVPLPNNPTDDALETFCRDSLGSYWHYHGGCIVGKVVDGGLRVNGIDALRSVDSSTFPVTPASHPMGFYLMLGWYVMHTCNRLKFSKLIWLYELVFFVPFNFCVLVRYMGLQIREIGLGWYITRVIQHFDRYYP